MSLEIYSTNGTFLSAKGFISCNLLAILNDDAFYRCVGSATVEGVHITSSVRPPTFYFLDSRGLVDGTAAALAAVGQRVAIGIDGAVVHQLGNGGIGSQVPHGVQRLFLRFIVHLSHLCRELLVFP